MPISRYRNARLPFSIASAGDVFQFKKQEIFEELPNVFGITDDIVIVGYEADGKDHARMLS